MKNTLKYIYENQILKESKTIYIGWTNSKKNAISQFKNYCKNSKLDCSDIDSNNVTFRKQTYFYTTISGEETIALKILPDAFQTINNCKLFKDSLGYFVECNSQFFPLNSVEGERFDSKEKALEFLTIA